MEKNEIRGYEPLVEELKQLIHKKQYHVLKVINAETINLYWEIGEEIYKQQQEKGWGKSIVQVLSRELQKEFPGAKGYSAANLWRMRNFYLTYRHALKNINMPIGVATYQLRNTLPEEMKEMLPEPEEIVKRLKVFEKL